jgi:hypothetical protein
MLYYIIYVMLYINSVKYITDVFQEHQGAAARERERERESVLVCERVRVQERAMPCVRVAALLQTCVAHTANL